MTIFTDFRLGNWENVSLRIRILDINNCNFINFEEQRFLIVDSTNFYSIQVLNTCVSVQINIFLYKMFL